MKLSNVKSKIDDFFDNLSEEDIERIKQKYFPESTIPKGWVSIEDHLPQFLVKDVEVGYSTYKVRNEEEFYMDVTDPNIFYYKAKELGVTHWHNNK